MLGRIRDIRARLRSEINSQTASIYGFPSELIGTIGSHLGPRDLWRASFTSCYIRETLVNDPSLWTNIDYANPRLASIFLERASPPFPLSVSIPHHSVKSPLLQPLTDSANRIGELSVDDFSPELDKIFSRARGSMETLKINDCSGTTKTQIPTLEFRALVSLTIRGDPVVLHAPSLTRFTFDGRLDHKGRDVFLEFLSQCPKLEELTVRHGRVSGDDDMGKVKLDNLRTYTDITDSRSPRHDLNLYHHLSLTAKTVCSLIYTQELPQPKYGHSMSTLAAEPEWLSIKTTTGLQDESKKVYYEGVMEINDATTGHWFSSVMRSNSSSLVNMRYARGVSSINKEKLKTVYVEGIIDPPSPEKWLSSLPNIETLVLFCDGATSAYLRVLAPRHWNDAKFLRLKSIVIRDQRGVGEGILRVLVERRGARCPDLQSVHFLSSIPCKQETVRELRSLVTGEVQVAKEGDTVDWNVDNKTLEILTRRVV